MWCRHKLLLFLRSRYLPCGKLSYFIYTKILDQQCIFMGSSLFPIFELKCEKISASMYGIKTLYHGKCLNDFYSLVVIQQKTHSFATLTFSFFFYAFLLVNWNCFVRTFYGIISLYQQVKCHLQLFFFYICICCNKGLMVDRSALKICWLKKFVYSQLMTKYYPGLFYKAPSSLIKFVIMVQFFSCPGTCFSNVAVT